MYFLGHSFFSYKYSMDATPINSSNFTSIVASNAIFDDIFIGKNVDMNTDILEWNFDTIFLAPFQGNLSAGNVSEKLSEITSVVVKRRAVGKNLWLPIFEIPINSENDLKFELFDRYVANKQPYQYAIVFLLNNEEGSYNINEITPQFDGIFIVDAHSIFSSTIETHVDVNRKHDKAVITTIDKKYPFVISQSKNNYDSGTISAVFAQLNEATCQFDFDGAYEYRKDLNDFLANGSTKFLKLEDGRIWMMVVTSEISNIQEANTKKFITSFDWVEIGGSEDLDDLANNNFIVSERI